MDDALRDKILASLDPAPDRRPDKALARALDRDPAARAYAAGLRRVDRALRSWPLRERPESAWEAAEARVLAALEADAKVRGGARVPPGEIDDLAPPSFDDDGASTMETPPAMSEPNEHDPDLDNLAALTRTSLAPGAVPSVRPHAPSLADAADDTSSGIVDIKQLSAIARDAASTAPPKPAEPAAAAREDEPKSAAAKPAAVKADAKPATKKDDVMVTAKPAVPVLSTEAPRRTGGGPMWAIGGMAVMAGAFLIYNSSRDSAPTSPSAIEANAPSNAAPESVPQAVPVATAPTPAEPATAAPAQAAPEPAPAPEAAPAVAPPPPPAAEPVAAPATAQARRHAVEPAAATPHRERAAAPTAPAPAPAPAPARPAATTAAAPTPPPAARPAPAAPAAAPAGGAPSSVDDLLRRAAPTAPAPTAAATAAPSADLPERLGRAQITGVLSPLTGAVRSCAQGQTGTAPVAIVIGNDGAVRSATVSGQFAGTPVGDCIAGVVRRAHFPQFRAPTQNLMFPYVITPPRN